MPLSNKPIYGMYDAARRYIQLDSVRDAQFFGSDQKDVDVTIGGIPIHVRVDGSRARLYVTDRQDAQRLIDGSRLVVARDTNTTNHPPSIDLIVEPTTK